MQRNSSSFEYTILFRCTARCSGSSPRGNSSSVWFVPLFSWECSPPIRGLPQHGITEASDPLSRQQNDASEPSDRLFLLNENYHLEHHSLPEIPSYHHLPRLHPIDLAETAACGLRAWVFCVSCRVSSRDYREWTKPPIRPGEPDGAFAMNSGLREFGSPFYGMPSLSTCGSAAP